MCEDVQEISLEIIFLKNSLTENKINKKCEKSHVRKTNIAALNGYDIQNCMNGILLIYHTNFGFNDKYDRMTFLWLGCLGGL